MRRILLTILLMVANLAYALDKPVAIDTRIKTLIYSENEVFRVVVNYGYQTNIEFAENEEIQTISVGNNFAWQLTPVGRRLFIKPLEDNILTNMTILTNKRAYQFEIQSKNLTNTLDEELVFVLRFFYPEEDIDSQRPIVKAIVSEPVPVIKPYNFNYSFAGDASFRPLKVFDDGRNTFFKFASHVTDLPKFVAANNNEELEPKRRGDYIVINKIVELINLEMNSDVVHIRNDDLVRKARGANE